MQIQPSQFLQTQIDKQNYCTDVRKPAVHLVMTPQWKPERQNWLVNYKEEEKKSLLFYWKDKNTLNLFTNCHLFPTQIFTTLAVLFQNSQIQIRKIVLHQFSKQSFAYLQIPIYVPFSWSLKLTSVKVNCKYFSYKANHIKIL